jgi:2-polyprenyl-3-methyl-5-hydroxy-6-metoxy-1,4-benzoquinol methylase
VVASNVGASRFPASGFRERHDRVRDESPARELRANRDDAPFERHGHVIARCGHAEAPLAVEGDAEAHEGLVVRVSIRFRDRRALRFGPEVVARCAVAVPLTGSPSWASPVDRDTERVSVPATGYDTKQASYFGFARSEVFGLLPPRMDRVLEIGCGTGATLAALRSTGRCSWTMGVELVESAAREARGTVNDVRVGDIETMDLALEPGSFDAILCLDVLEHLVDPWAVVRRLATALRPRGTLIASLPNVRNFRVIIPLLLMGRWTYADSGQLDQTHLRFFTRRSAIELVAQSGLNVDRVDPLLGWRGQLLGRLSLGTLSPFLDFQYLVRGTKA